VESKQFHNNCLKLLRRERGLTQKQVARILGLKSSSTISRWESGFSLPDTLNALKLAAVYRSAVDVIYEDLREAISDELLQRERAIFR